MKVMKRVHWRKYITRKVLIVAGIMLALQLLEHITRWHFAGKIAEFSTSSLVEHVLFGVPMEES